MLLQLLENPWIMPGSWVSDSSSICLDVGIGFSKTFEQNLELLASLQVFNKRFPEHAMMIGVSRKSFIGKITNEENPKKREAGSLAANVISVANGANVVRVHDVRATVDALKVVRAIESYK